MTESETDFGTWLTKAELAHVRRISIASATRLIRRQGWRRQPGNDGRVRVLVPEDWMHPRHDDPRDDDAADPMDQLADPGDQPADPMDNSRELKALRDTFETTLEHIERVHARELAAVERARDTAEALAKQMVDAARDSDEAAKIERARAEAQLADAASDVRELRAHAAALQVELAERQAALDRTQAEARTAQERAEAQRKADDARKTRGLVARLRAAVRGQ